MQIATGEVQETDVVKIITGTRLYTQEEWDRAIIYHRKNSWGVRADAAETILRRLLLENKIEQPRLKNNAHYPDLKRYGDVIWVESEDKIIWNGHDSIQ